MWPWQYSLLQQSSNQTVQHMNNWIFCTQVSRRPCTTFVPSINPTSDRKWWAWLECSDFAWISCKFYFTRNDTITAISAKIPVFSTRQNWEGDGLRLDSWVPLFLGRSSLALADSPPTCPRFQVLMAPNLLPKRPDHIQWCNRNIIGRWLYQCCRWHCKFAICWGYIWRVSLSYSKDAEGCGKQYSLYTHPMMMGVWQWPLLFSVFSSLS